MRPFSGFLVGEPEKGAGVQRSGHGWESAGESGEIPLTSKSRAISSSAAKMSAVRDLVGIRDWIGSNIKGWSRGHACKAERTNQGVTYVWAYPESETKPSHEWVMAHETGHCVGDPSHTTKNFPSSSGFVPGTDNELRLMTGEPNAKSATNPRRDDTDEETTLAFRPGAPWNPAGGSLDVVKRFMDRASIGGEPRMAQG